MSELAVNADKDGNGKYSQAELQALTISQIKDLATYKGYTITATKKADIITEFIAQQQ